MRKILASCAIVLACSFSVFAQTAENRNEEGKVVRGPYETQKFWDNTFVNAAVGLNIFTGDNRHLKVGTSTALDINVGKFFTPTIGARLGYSGLSINTWTNEEYNFSTKFSDKLDAHKAHMPYYYLHVDALWNISNAIGGYRSDRLWDFVPYATAGLAATYGKNADTDHELAVGLGLLNNIRVAERFYINIDLRQIFVNNRIDQYHKSTIAGVTTMTVGATYRFGSYFSRTGANEGVSTAAYDALNSENAALKDKEAALKADVAKALADAKAAQEAAKAAQDALAAAEKKAKNAVLDLQSFAVYFDLGQTTLSELELSHLEESVKVRLAADPERTFEVIGTTDASGSSAVNEVLRQKRAEYVAEYIRSKFNLSEEKVVVKTVEADYYFFNHSEKDRAAIIR